MASRALVVSGAGGLRKKRVRGVRPDGFADKHTPALFLWEWLDF